MFDGKKYMTRGIHERMPIEQQIFMWQCIANLKIKKDYLQVFRFSVTEDGKQKVIHTQEQPDYYKEYIISFPNNAEGKVYVIDDVEYSTMLFAEEY